MGIKFGYIFSSIFLTLNLAFGANLMRYEVFDNGAQIDIVLSFDQQYLPVIFQDQSDDSTTITLQNLISEEKYTSQLNSKIIGEFSIIPFDGSTRIVFHKARDIKISALASKDDLSLSLRITNPAFAQLKIQSSDEQVKDDNIIQNIKKYGSFLVAALFLVAFFVFAKLFFKRKKSNSLESFFAQNVHDSVFDDKIDCNDDRTSNKITPKETASANESENASQTQTEDSNLQIRPNLSDTETYLSQKTAQIIFEKELNGNKFAVIEHEQQKYLIVLNNANLLSNELTDELKNCKSFEEFYDKNFASLSESVQNSQNSLKNYIEKAIQD